MVRVSDIFQESRPLAAPRGQQPFPSGAHEHGVGTRDHTSDPGVVDSTELHFGSLFRGCAHDGTHDGAQRGRNVRGGRAPAHQEG